MNRDRLIEAGVDYDEGAERFGGNPAVYEKYLARFFQSDYMDKIERQIVARDIAAAFRTTHDLKAVMGNLSMERCYQAVCALTELLRSQDPDIDCARELALVRSLYDQAKAAADISAQD